MPTKKVLEKQLAQSEDEIDALQNKNTNLKIDGRTKDKLIENLKTGESDKDKIIERLKKDTKMYFSSTRYFKKQISELTEKCTGLETKNKNLMKDIVEMNDKIKELTGVSQKVPEGTIIGERFKGITYYVLEGKSLSRETPGWHPNLEALSEAMSSQKSSILSQGATDVNQKIRREVTFESDA